MSRIGSEVARPRHLLVLALVTCLAGCGAAGDGDAEAEPGAFESTAQPLEAQPQEKKPGEEPPEDKPGEEPPELPEMAPPDRTQPRALSDVKPKNGTLGRPHRAAAAASIADPGPLELRGGTGKVELVEVYYATDRERLTARLVLWRGLPLPLAFGLGGLLWMFWDRKRVFSIIGWLACFGISGFGIIDASSKVIRDYDAWQRLDFRFGPQSAEGLRFGSCTVSIPPRHEPGEIEQPSLLWAEVREDPDEHLIIQSIRSVDHSGFFEEIDTAAKRGGDEILVFIHGYNVTFERAIQRSAQLKFDLEYPGPVICYSWPSQGDVEGYPVDKDNMGWVAANLARFLRRLLRERQPQSSDGTAEAGGEARGLRINIVAHSMGNLALVTALKELAAEPPPTRLDRVVMAAPDVESRDFRDNAAKQILPLANRFTLYASAKDKALIASKQYNGNPRVGDAGPDLIVMEGLDTVDASAIDTGFLGHTYYASKQELLVELHAVLLRRLEPSQRDWLRQKTRGELHYWVFPGKSMDPVLE